MKLSTHGRLVGISSMKDLTGRMVMHQNAAVEAQFPVADVLKWADKLKQGQYLGTAWLVFIMFLTAYLFFGVHHDVAAILVFLIGYLAPFFGIGFYLNSKGKDPAFFASLENDMGEIQSVTAS